MNVEIPDKFKHFEINEDIEKTLECVYTTKENVILIGKAGSGKSTILHIIKEIDEHSLTRTVFLGPTGIAAVNIEGSTIHSFLKIGITPKKPHHHSLHPQVKGLLSVVDRIIIDEISMVRADLFDILDHLCKKAKDNDMLMGGIQIICVGDLYQLPPIIGNSKEESLFYTDMYGDNPYFFASNSYRENENQFRVIELRKIYRQKDNDFKEILNRIRKGIHTREDLNRINERMMSHIRHKSRFPDSVYLAPINYTVDQINKQEIDAIELPSVTFNANIVGYVNPKNFRAPTKLVLKKGAKIMMLVNDQNGLYQNGTLAVFDRVINHNTVVVIIGGHEVYVQKYFFDEYKYELVNGNLEKVKKGSFIQFPIKLGYAFSIHKSQGCTFEEGFIDFGDRDLFGEHMAYVALSRFTDLERINIRRKLCDEDIKINRYVIEFMEKVEG